VISAGDPEEASPRQRRESMKLAAIIDPKRSVR